MATSDIDIMQFLQRKTLSVSGETISSGSSGQYYKDYQNIVDSSYTIVDVYWESGWDPDVRLQHNKRGVNLICPTQKTLSSNRTVVIVYVPDAYIS